MSTPNTPRNVAVVGGGFMGEAVIAGLVPGGHNVVVVEKRADRAEELQSRYGVSAGDIEAAVGEAEVVFVVVKPGDVPSALSAIAGHLKPGAVVVSLAAGVRLATMESALPPGASCIRVMPNTPALIGKGAMAMSTGSSCSEEQADLVTSLLAELGLVVRVPEHQQDAVTALSGSGPAYVFAFVEALIDGGVLLGLPRDTARALALATLSGSAAMLHETGEHPALLREKVTSPGGTTAAALQIFDDRGLKAAVLAGMKAARDRSVELG